jgi:hypothetical protein
MLRTDAARRAADSISAPLGSEEGIDLPRRARLGGLPSAKGRPDNRAGFIQGPAMRPRHLTPYFAAAGILALLTSFALALVH